MTKRKSRKQESLDGTQENRSVSRVVLSEDNLRRSKGLTASAVNRRVDRDLKLLRKFGF